MKRTTLLKITGLTRQEEENTKQKDGEEEMKSKEEANLHHLKIPLLG
jgi:hypothetical protein